MFNSNMFLKLCCVVCLAYVKAGTDIGDECYQDGQIGTCKLLINCMSAFNDPKRGWWKFNRCGFEGEDPIICCLPSPAASTPPTVTTTPQPVATTPRKLTTTTEYYPPVYDYVSVTNSSEVDGGVVERANDGCPELAPEMVPPPKTGRKAYDKCIEYQQQLIYPCEPSYALTGGMERGYHCHHNADQLIVGGVDAAQYEFPHMVLLGYGRTNDSAEWKCGGTLLSERFILTAAHCTSSRDPVVYAIVGALKRSDDVQSSQVYRIGRIIKYPFYHAPSKYHDVALLETATPIKLDHTTVPACLDVFGGERTQVTATGWGAVQFMGQNADTLQKVTLTEFSERECITKFPSNRHNAAYDASTQICYGDHFRAADTCQGDSGGPLTILNHKVHCMYTVIGITSFGKWCGNIVVPGYYTKVSHYVPWIESIVWP